MLNTCTLVGKVVTKPTILKGATKHPTTTFMLETERPFLSVKNKITVDRFEVEVWRGIAQQVNDICEVGDIIGIRGRLQTKNEKPASVIIIAEKIAYIEKRVLAKTQTKK